MCGGIPIPACCTAPAIAGGAARPSHSPETELAKDGNGNGSDGALNVHGVCAGRRTRWNAVGLCVEPRVLMGAHARYLSQAQRGHARCQYMKSKGGQDSREQKTVCALPAGLPPNTTKAANNARGTCAGHPCAIPPTNPPTTSTPASQNTKRPEGEIGDTIAVKPKKETRVKERKERRRTRRRALKDKTLHLNFLSENARRDEAGGKRRKEEVKKTQMQLELTMADCWVCGAPRAAGASRQGSAAKETRVSCEKQNKKGIGGRKERREGEGRGRGEGGGKGCKHTKNLPLSVSLLILSTSFAGTACGAPFGLTIHWHRGGGVGSHFPVGVHGGRGSRECGREGLGSRVGSGAESGGDSHRLAASADDEGQHRCTMRKQGCTTRKRQRMRTAARWSYARHASVASHFVEREEGRCAAREAQALYKGGKRDAQWVEANDSGAYAAAVSSGWRRRKPGCFPWFREDGEGGVGDGGERGESLTLVWKVVEKAATRADGLGMEGDVRSTYPVTEHTLPCDSDGLNACYVARVFMMDGTFRRVWDSMGNRVADGDSAGISTVNPQKFMQRETPSAMPVSQKPFSRAEPRGWLSSAIKDEPPAALGITVDETDRFRVENAIPGSDDIDMWAQEPDSNDTPRESPEKRPRERSGTESTTGSDSYAVKQNAKKATDIWIPTKNCAQTNARAATRDPVSGINGSDKHEHTAGGSSVMALDSQPLVS
ncbi:hypothetical protein B0H19DRAFT_1081098 [Mycena capillaripes]|nr:hypothetical protein B0H19DRAFT_1081098 [Mycena capillaripes]